MTIGELLDHLDGAGLTITDYDAIADELHPLGLAIFDEIERVAPAVALQRLAAQSAANRGHRMSPWAPCGEHVTRASCERCGMEVRTNTRPMPNEIDIAGEAVALNCTGAAS